MASASVVSDAADVGAELVDLQDFLVILSDFDEVEVEPPSLTASTSTSSEKTSKKPSMFLYPPLVEETLGRLRESLLSSEAVKAALGKTNADVVFEEFTWLNTCLMIKQQLVASREKVWEAYHGKMVDHLSDLAKVTGGSRVAAALMGLQLMKQLIEGNFKRRPSSVTASTEVTDTERDILQYIAGYLLKKFNNRPECLSLRASEHSGLIATKDRGGLVYPNTDFVAVVSELEYAFRECGWTSTDRRSFLALVLEKDILDHFCGILNHFDSDFQSKEKLFVDICNLFFLMRINQKCRQFVESYVKKTKVSRKSKPLRESV